MFVSAVIPLIAQDSPPPQINHFLGRAGHAIFFELLRKANAPLAEGLHQDRTAKPFTVSGIVNPSAPFEVMPEICKGRAYEWRITAYRTDLTECLLNDVLPHLPSVVRFGSIFFQTGVPIVDTATHSWACITSAEALMERWYQSSVRVEKRLMLEFSSPTTYRQIHRNVLLPNPVGLFPGYLDAWNRHNAPRLEPNLTSRVANDLVISRYRLETQSILSGEYKERGWLGECEFSIMSEQDSLARLVHLLGDFAMFCGTGYKTTQGMGQTRMV